MEFTPDQVQILTAFVLILVLSVQAVRFLFQKTQGKPLDNKYIDGALGVIALILGYFFLSPTLPPTPICGEVEVFACAGLWVTWVSSLVTIAAALVGAGKAVYDYLARGLFERMGFVGK